MSKKPEPNPDHERWTNDKKQKRLTKRHLQQKIDYMKKSLEQSIRWNQQGLERIKKDMEKIKAMELQLEQME